MTDPAQIIEALTPADIEAWARRMPAGAIVGRRGDPSACIVSRYLWSEHGIRATVCPYQRGGPGARPDVQIDGGEIVALPESIAALARASDELGPWWQPLTAAVVLHELFGEVRP